MKRADTRPLYVQVRATLIDRIQKGDWKPGQLIPNEFEIAAELGVSQGTARKALDSLAADNLLVRRQGRGTFVVEHTPANVLFRFFNIFDDGGTQIQPEGKGAVPVRARANPEEAQALELAPAANVIRLSRVRRRSGRPFIVETICLPEALYPGLAQKPELPNTLYDLFQKEYGLLVTRADERVTAVLAADAEAKTLAIPVGAPLLRISRIAIRSRRTAARMARQSLSFGRRTLFRAAEVAVRRPFPRDGYLRLWPLVLPHSVVRVRRTDEAQ